MLINPNEISRKLVTWKFRALRGEKKRKEKKDNDARNSLAFFAYGVVKAAPVASGVQTAFCYNKVRSNKRREQEELRWDRARVWVNPNQM